MSVYQRNFNSFVRIEALPLTCLDNSRTLFTKEEAMRTQSLDTHPEAERVLIEVIRKASITKRFQLVQSLTQSARWSSIQTWLQSHPETQERDAALHLVTCSFGAGMAQIARIALEQDDGWHVQPANILAVITPAIAAFHELGVPCYLGGSLASSLYGMQQMAQDVDLIVDLRNCPVSSLSTTLMQHYLFEESVIRQAILRHSSFSLLHLNSLMKIDVIVPKFDAFDIAMRPHIREYILDKHYSPFCVASVYEMILFKLQRYHRHEQAYPDRLMDDTEWNDIVGMLKVQGPLLDQGLLIQWVERLDIAMIWQKATSDAGERKTPLNVHVS
jgi:hypothetical protein